MRVLESSADPHRQRWWRWAAFRGSRLLGSVPDVLPHLGDACVLAVPLEAGGGTRLKILEAFAAGLPVVSTPVGCEGIDATDGEHLLVAPRERMAESILSLLSDRRLGERLATLARALVRERYDWNSVGATACNAVETAIAVGRKRSTENISIRLGPA